METTTNLLLFLCLLGDFNCADDLIERGLYLSIIIYKRCALLFISMSSCGLFRAGTVLQSGNRFNQTASVFVFLTGIS